jgi:hypothetical protein
MHAKCPRNAGHNRFVTVAHVSEYWVVDETGEFIDKRGDGQVTHRPHPDNIWICDECGALAEVKA